MRAGTRLRWFTKWISEQIVRFNKSAGTPLSPDEADVKALDAVQMYKDDGVPPGRMAEFLAWYSATTKASRSANANKGWTKDARKKRFKARDRRESIRKAKSPAKSKVKYNDEVGIAVQHMTKKR